MPQHCGIFLRFIDYANASWADVGTPTLTGGQTAPWSGTYASSAVQFDDNDAGAYEGRSQSVTVSAGAAYFMHCYVKAGTASDARILLERHQDLALVDVERGVMDCDQRAGLVEDLIASLALVEKSDRLRRTLPEDDIDVFKADGVVG